MDSKPRRSFRRNGTLCVAGHGANPMLAADVGAKPLLRIGMMPDLHYADKEPTKTRFYREALGKLDEAVDYFNKERPAFVVEVGDLIDKAARVEQETGWLGAMEKDDARLWRERSYGPVWHDI